MRRLLNLAWLLLMLGMALAYPWLPEQVGAPGKEAIALTAGLYAWPALEAHRGPLPPAWSWAGGAALLLCFLICLLAQFRQFPAAPPAPEVDTQADPRRPNKPRTHGQP